MELREASRTELRNIYVTHPEILADRGKLEILLRDYGHNPQEMNLLLQAFDQSVPHRILNPNPGVPPEVNLAKLSTYLHQDRFMEKNAANWAVNSWASALGVGVATVTKVRDIPPADTGKLEEASNEASAEKPKDLPVQIKFDTDGKVVAYLPGHEPMNGYKINFHGDRLWKLLFGVFVASRFVLASRDLTASLGNLYAEYPGLIQLAAAAIVLCTAFSIKKRFKPLF